MDPFFGWNRQEVEGGPPPWRDLAIRIGAVLAVIVLVVILFG